MKTYSKLLWGLAALPMLASCSQDDVVSPVNPGDETAGVYMSFDLKFSKDTRSYTDGDNSSNDGVEYGSANENQVNSVLIVLANASNNNFVAYTVIPEEKLTHMTADGQPVYRATGKFNKTTINDYYTSTTSRDVNVYVFCNPSSTFTQYIRGINPTVDPNGWVNRMEDVIVGEASQNALWSGTNGFFMSNFRVAKRSLPRTIDDWNGFMTETNPFNLSGINNAGQPSEVDNNTDRGPIDVHRLAARFDFRDGSQMGGDDNNGVPGTPFTYNVVFNKENKPLVQCEIVSMAVVNMINKQYVLERVSANGLDANSILCGAEQPWYSNALGQVIPNSGNFVVSAYANDKNSGISSNFGNYFNYPFFDSETGKVMKRGDGWKFTSVKTIMNDSTKDYDGAGDYHKWRYVTENTMPGEADDQMNGQSTGVVFEARMKAPETLKESTDKWEKKLYEILNATVHSQNPYADPILFAINGSLYASWENVQEAALYAAGFDATKGQNQTLDRTTYLYTVCYGTGGVGTVKDDEGNVIFTDELEEDPNATNTAFQIWNNAGRPRPENSSYFNTFRDRAVGHNFTLYLSNQNENGDWGYYCYYYYWNRHNDNGQQGVMGPMEFATVRNNVYKLAVTRLAQLGHPRVPENDPDTPTPDTPDESADIYMTVSVRVLPWVVRINNIKF